MSRRRYWVRRLGALAVVVGLAVGVVAGVSAVIGGDDGGAGSGGDGSAATGDSSVGGAGALDDPAVDGVGDPAVDGGADPALVGVVDTGSPAASGVDAVDPSSTAVDTVAADPPTAENPARVLIIGDSDAGTFGPYLKRLLDGTGIVETELDYKVSSGLARPDFFDWFAEARRLLPESDPDIVIVTFGGNDGQALTAPDGSGVAGMPENDTDDWRAEYEKRAGEMMDLLLENGRSVIWVGIPNDDNPDVTARMAIQDQSAKAAAATRPGVVFIDTWTRFSGRDGGWAEFVIDPRDGQGKDVRASDGFHLNEVGAEILALDIAQAIRDDLRARGAAI